MLPNGDLTEVGEKVRTLPELRNSTLLILLRVSPCLEARNKDSTSAERFTATLISKYST